MRYTKVHLYQNTPVPQMAPKKKKEKIYKKKKHIRQTPDKSMTIHVQTQCSVCNFLIIFSPLKNSSTGCDARLVLTAENRPWLLKRKKKLAVKMAEVTVVYDNLTILNYV